MMAKRYRKQTTPFVNLPKPHIGGVNVKSPGVRNAMQYATNH